MNRSLPRHPSEHPTRSHAATALAAAALIALGLLTPAAHDPAHAALADLASTPLGVNVSNGKPNVMFILDDSGSMAWWYMPDDLEDPADKWARPTNYGTRSIQCNGIAYNPSITYELPIKADGTRYPASNFTTALLDGYDATKGTVDLSAEYYYTYTGSQAALNWRYNTDGSKVASTFRTECLTLETTPLGVFTRVNANTLTTAQKTNYANWFSYYSRRYLTMRSSAGQAFAKLDANYRVGFTRISDGSITSTTFLNVSDFDTTQRDSFFTLLYTVAPTSSTPLRESLSKVGRYYAKTISGQTYDPMVNSATDSTLNSCRRNYAILSTDGYWNGNTGKQLNGYTDIGNEDGSEARPMKDGGVTVQTTVVTTERTDTRTTTGTSVRTITNGGERIASGVRSCGFWWFGNTEKTQQTQRATVTQSATRTLTESLRYATETTTTTSNGVVTSGPTTTTTDNGTVSTTSDTYGAWGSPTYSGWSNVGGVTVTTGCGSNGAVTSTPTYGTPYLIGGGSSSTAWSTPPASTTVTGATTSSTSANTTVVNGDSGSLADVAAYYYKNDLRPDIPDNLNVKAGTLDTAKHQHMTTFTLGLGVKGVLTYDPNYLTQTVGDYVDLKNGTKNWPIASGTTGGAENATHVDDLWHAAVNGRGRYFSAQNPSDVSTALTSALNSIAKDSGTGSASATSSLMPTSGGDDLVFLPSFDAARWSGDLKAFHFTYNADGVITGVDVSEANKLWSAKAKLDAMTLSNRKVYFNKPSGSTPTLTLLTYANLPTGALKTSFDNRCTVTVPFLQCATMNATAKAKVTGTNLVSYLTGDRSLEMSDTAPDNSVFRKRDSRLGDFVNASPVYVGGPAFRYADAGYAAYKVAQKNRKRVVYAAANDGMLHAFATGTSSSNNEPDATGGNELWAFVPSAALANMAQLGDTAYDTNHQVFVDATPIVGDVYDGSSWRTILVGGLGKGGKAYYALDITDPDAPSLLWEVSSADTNFANLGYTFGNPIITKLAKADGTAAAGTWVVTFSSGVNNVGDGVGRVFVVNAVTGAHIRTVSTGVGTTTTPSNLVKLNAWLRSDTDNTALRLYGGDMQGNFWRFDHNDNLAPAGTEATLMGVATNAANVRQPITTKPVLVEALIGGVRRPLVSFGTGRYLGDSDLADTTQQTIWVLKDTLGTAADTTTAVATPFSPDSMFGYLRSTGAKLVDQPMAASHVMGTPQTLDWATKNGWYVDLDQAVRERINIDPSYLQGATVAYSSSVPSATSCSGMGSSYVYKLDLSGGTFSLMSTSATKMNVGVTTYLDRSNGVNTKSNILATKEDQSVETIEGAVLPSALGKIPRRSAWREIVD